MFALAGCAANADHITLDSRWAPLKRVQRDMSVPRGLYKTAGDVILTSDVEDFRSRDMLDQESLLLHEQHHAITQQDLGLRMYFVRYDNDNDLGFRAEEERAGWSLYIRNVVAHGGKIDVDATAKVFANVYKIGTFESAVEWVRGEIARAR